MNCNSHNLLENIDIYVSKHYGLFRLLRKNCSPYLTPNRVAVTF